MIEVNNLSVHIDKKVILEDLNFALYKGTLCILGLNGIGKTTLLKTLVGLNGAYKGKIIINQKDLSHFSRRSLAKIVSLVPQEYMPYFDFTVKEMVMFGRTPYIGRFGLPSKTDNEKVDKIITEIGLRELENRNFKGLSGGEKGSY